MRRLRQGKIIFDLKQIATETKPVGMDYMDYTRIPLSHNISILKIASWPPGHYDVINEIQNLGF